MTLRVRRASQLGTLLRRIEADPIISMRDVCRIVHQPGKVPSRGPSPLSPTRASFVLDLLAEATEEVDRAVRIDARKAVMSLRGVREAIAAAPVLGVPTEAPPAAPAAPDVHIVADKVRMTLSPPPAATPPANEVSFPDAPALRAPDPRFEMPDWYRAMAAALDSGRHVSIAGPPGIGKSTAPEHYFATKGQSVVVVNGEGGLRRRDLEGVAEARGGTTSFTVAEFAAAAVHGWAVVFNEVNACEPDALLLINGVVEVPHRLTIHGQSFPVHPDFRLVVTYNPGLAGTKPLPPSFKDRFFPVRLDFPGDDFLRRLLVARGLPPDARYAAELIVFARRAWDLHAKGKIRYQISPRRLHDAVFLMESGAATRVGDALELAVMAAVDSASDRAALVELLKPVEAPRGAR